MIAQAGYDKSKGWKISIKNGSDIVVKTSNWKRKFSGLYECLVRSSNIIQIHLVQLPETYYQRWNRYVSGAESRLTEKVRSLNESLAVSIRHLVRTKCVFVTSNAHFLFFYFDSRGYAELRRIHNEMRKLPMHKIRGKNMIPILPSKEFMNELRSLF